MNLVNGKPFKDWIHWLIIGAAVIVCIFILYGLFTSLASLRNNRKEVLNARSGCQTCLTEQDNNRTLVVRPGMRLSIELEAAMYPQENLTILADPTNALSQNIDAASVQGARWTSQFDALEKGRAEIFVTSSKATISDFRVVIVIE